MSTATTERVTLFRLAVRQAPHRSKHPQRINEVIEHLEQWAEARVSMLHDGEKVIYLLVEPARPVRVQAAKDIASTCPHYVVKSFKVLGVGGC